MVKLLAGVVAGVTALVLAAASAAAPPTFSNTTLFSPWSASAFFQPPAGLVTAPHANQSGNSEPAIDFGGSGNVMAVDGLGWLPFQVNLWKGHFGDTPPAYFGGMDTLLPISGAGRLNLGDGDADVEVTSAGTILLADLDIIFNHQLNQAQLGVSVTRCPASATGPAGCTSTLIDQAGADREWITTIGTNAWLSYHDSRSSSLIHVWRSTDDGRTWTPTTGPIPGQGSVTGDSTFNNSIGPIVADAHTGNVYQPFMAGEAGIQKGTSSAFNNVYVSRSTDGGRTWTPHLVYHAPLFTDLANFWPALGVDPSDGALYVAWTDRHGVWVSSSTDQGDHWSMPLKVSPASAATTVMPWVATLNGKVDVVYYGSTASSTDDAAAVWNTYDSQRNGGVWTTGLVSNTPNRVGRVCLNGSACTADRELLDLFEVAEDPGTGKAAVIYTDTTIDTWTFQGTTHQLPEIVLAYEH
jgi:hypothetical protein